jgi:HEAT repeat protein
MEPFSTASMLAIAGKLVTTEVTKAAVAGIKRQLQPDEMAVVLQKAIESAQAAEALHSPTSGLFHGFQPKAGQEFLEKFLRSGEVVKELQKPLQDDGKPDVEMLVTAFTKAAEDRSEATKYLHCLRPWMEAFVESYFEQVKGICFQVAKAQYLKQLAHRVDDVKFVGIAVPGEEVEKQEVLAQIFVMPDVREENNRISPRRFVAIEYAPKTYEDVFSFRDSFEMQGHVVKLATARQIKQNNLLEEQKEWALRDRSAPRIPAQKVINLAQKKAVVLGAPGSGKTMLVSYFALMLCGTTQSDPTQIGLEKDADYLPIVVRIRDWILQPKMGLLEYLRSNAEASLACKELPTGFFEHWLERGRALILLDGLDEVVDEAQRRKVAEQIETFLHQYQDNPAVITSRPAGYRWDFFNLDEFPHYTLESFDDKQVATFIDHWYDSRLKEDPAQSERRKADLQKAFARNERIRLLAKNPLLLTIISLIHRYQAELPRQRCKLYEKAVETLLTSWDSGKEIKLYSQVLLFLKLDDLLYILKKLAYWIHTQGSTGETEGGTLIDKDELIQQLRTEIQKITACKTHEAKAEAERFVDFIQKRTGLLNEQGRDRYAFVHKTFQEYLTAEEIYEIDESGEDTEIIGKHFREHLHDPHWREVLLLLVSKLKGKKAQNAIQTVLDAGSEYEQWLHRDLLFAGWCLTEDPSRLTTVAQDFVGGILDRLVGLEVENSDRIGRKIRGEVGKILSSFSETTVEQGVLIKLELHKDRINIFRLVEFQIALRQELEAINILFSLMRGKNYSARYDAARVLGKLGNVNPSVVIKLLSLLRSEVAEMRSIAADALGELESSSSVVISGLLSLLNDKDSSVHSSSIVALGRLGNTTSSVVNGLLSMPDNIFSFLPSPIGILSKLGNANPIVLSGCLPLLDDENPDVQYRAAVLLCQTGNGIPKVLNILLSSLKDELSSFRPSHGVTALGKLGNANQEVVIILLSLLDNEVSDVRSSAAKALGELEAPMSEVINGLLSLLADKDSSVRSSAVEALGKLGDSTSEVISGLLPLLADKNSSVRSSTVEALGKLGSSTSEVISGLLPLLADKDGFISSRASAGLSRLAKTSDAIHREVLQWLEQNPNDDGIGSAIDCLWSIVVE